MTMDRKPRIAVVGGANVDLTAAPSVKYVPGDSCPGTVTLSYGGVGRNIAHNLVLMGCEVALVTAFGDDVLSAGLKSDCARLGIDTRHAVTIAGAACSTFVSINDEHGEMMSAVAAMDVIDHLTPELMSERIDMLNACDIVVLEANLPAATIAYLLDNCTAPVFADTVSTAKSHKLFGALAPSRRLHTLKLNRIEALELIGADAATPEAFDTAVASLHQRGVERVLITLGSQGCYYHDGTGSGIVPCEKVPVASVSGGGDAFLSGAVLAFSKGLDVNSTIKCALRAAALTVQCVEAVNPQINEKYVLSE